MKILTVLGTRPEIIRLSLIIPLLDRFADHHVLHTGQNKDRQLNGVFFEELGLRKPDVSLDNAADTPMRKIGEVLAGCERTIHDFQPDRVLILGDTNSGLSAFAAKRLGIRVFHAEAGNRCYDDRVPEEVNRRVIDHSSDVLMPYTERGRLNLLREGIPGGRIFVTGNPILEVLEHYRKNIEASTILKRLKLKSGQYYLVTLHRAENVDVSDRLEHFVHALNQLAEASGLPVVCSVHPRTRSQLERQGRTLSHKNVMALEPLGLFDFVHLEQRARCVLSDSGTVQEECSIFGVPNVTLRDVTERPETLEVGSNFITGDEPETILKAVEFATRTAPVWAAPPEYRVKNVSDTVARIVLGHYRWAT